EIEVKSKIKSVNIYLNGAQVTRKARVTIKKGNNVYVVKGVTPFLVANTLQISGTGKFTIIGVDSRNNYLDKIPDSPKIKIMRDSINIYSKKNEENIQTKDAFVQEKDMILQNKIIKGQNTSLNPDDLTKLANFYRTRIKDLNFKILKIDRSTKKNQNRITALSQQIAEITKNYKRNSSEVLVTINSKETTQGSLTISYQVNNAGWIPSYDIRSQNKNEGIEITYKASIFQNTGNDWNNIKITLSTGNLNLTNQKPELSTWYLQYYNEYNKKRSYSRSEKPSMAKESVASGDYKLDKSPAAPTLSNFTETIQNMVNTEFKISIPMNIKSDGKGKLIEVTKNQLAAQYRYYAVPKLDKSAFLIARITGWEKLYLLPGAISLYNNGSFVGKSYLDPQETLDTMEVSLGRDQFISFERNMVKNYNKNVLVGTQRKVQRGYEIKIRNNKNTDIELIVMDQIPISTISEIEVKLLESSGAKLEESTGFLTWKMNLKPQEKKKIGFKFSVKYPKNKKITNI
ncbi:MAG: mucoidy inhibitor MuiA family protein, partial [Bacteroidales bacterium]|nr:mucoidy inhibitor MuiA family protein [Bacteroidales bacterium]